MTRATAELEAQVLAWIEGKRPADFGETVRQLHGWQFRHNTPYRQFCEQAGIGETVERWRQVPSVPQEAFKHADLRSFPAEETIKTFRTSGTTGEGFGQHHLCTLEIYETAVREGWRHANMPTGPFLVIAPHPDEAPYSSLSRMLGVLAPRESFLAAGGTVDLARLQAIEHPVCLLGTALGFLNLFEQMDKAGITLRLPAGSTAMETGGYKGSGRNISRADLYAMFGGKLGIVPDDIYNEYGMTELSSQFYARGPQGLHHGPPWARAVVADPVTLDEVNEGETGILLIYDAANVGSVVGIRTQDLAVKRGDTFELLGRDPSALPRGCSRAADEWMSR
ncbi:MAG: hypothetical protein ACKOKC_00830 [Chthoniobacterales bacterium]